jgi:Uri superfamily endonuclease
MYINKDRTPRWHVDYLLLDPHFRLYSLICGPCEDDVECHLAEALCGGGVQGFGCSDCACYSHLFFRKKDPCHEVITTFQKLGITPAIKTIKNPGDDGKICKCSVSQGVCERKETPLN